MLHQLLQTNADWAGLILRLVLALVIFPHGAQKVLGWFGGYGYTGTMQFFTKQVGLPAPVAFTAIAAEFAGPIALVVGFGTRLAALLIAAVMIGSMSSAACIAWRILRFVITPALWLGAAVIHVLGFTMARSIFVFAFSRSYWSCLTVCAK